MVFYLKNFVYICNIKLNINIMANLTKELKKLANQKFDAIHEELLEQFESSQFNRQMIKYRNTKFEKEIKKPVLHIN